MTLLKKIVEVLKSPDSPPSKAWLLVPSDLNSAPGRDRQAVAPGWEACCGPLPGPLPPVAAAAANLAAEILAASSFTLASYSALALASSAVSSFCWPSLPAELPAEAGGAATASAAGSAPWISPASVLRFLAANLASMSALTWLAFDSHSLTSEDFAVKEALRPCSCSWVRFSSSFSLVSHS